MPRRIFKPNQWGNHVETPQSTVDQLHTLRDYLRFATSAFQRAGLHFGHGTDNAFDEAAALVLHCLRLPHEHLPELMDANLLRSERLDILEKIELRCAKRLPVPYITGEAWFAGWPFDVDARVLIPRSPIAELIETGFEPWLAGHYPGRILDLCTGSGCIGIACALYFDEAKVTLADVSEDALKVAEQNIARYQLAPRVQTAKGDLFADLKGQRFDIIVSNPPYVDAKDFAVLPAEYRHEPVLALASGDDGLDLTRRMLREAPTYLEENGLLIVEVGNSWEALEITYPGVPFLWLEFARGGHGVFVLNRAQLLEHADIFLEG